MCGINGIFAYRESAAPVDPRELLIIRDAMAARGPDGAGLWISPDGRIGLAHRRLAIIDLSENGAQPMATADGRYWITFNGEIYNYQALRAELMTRGCEFRSTSDTEVLLHLYRESGADMVKDLRGMFAFAIWDAHERSLFMARDPFGIKPLYYADDGKTIRFASQVKALMAGKRIDSKPEPAGHVGFFLLGSVPEPFTMFASIRALPAGSTLKVSQSQPARVVRYFDVAQEFLKTSSVSAMTREEVRATLREAITDSVRHHLVSDVPVGMFLSSGLDSSTIAALACQAQTTRLHTVTLGFKEYRATWHDETVLAKIVAQHLETNHETRWITRKAFEADFDRLLASMDQPSIDGVNTFFVSKVAAESGMRVALSGLGGDEILGGYPSFRHVPMMVRAFARFNKMKNVGRLTRQFLAPIVSHIASPKLAGLIEYGGSYGGAYLLRRALYMPWELGDLVDPKFVAQGYEQLDLLQRLQQDTTGLSNERQIVAALEIGWYMRNQLLRDADWAGMAHSLEIRVPFVDVSLFRKIAPLIAGHAPPTKLDSAAAPDRSLPGAVLRRGKTGFSIPVRDWIMKADSQSRSERGLRGWSRTVFDRYVQRRGKVLISTLAPAQGGVASMTEQVARCLQERGHEVAVAYYVPYSLAPDLSVPFWRVLFQSPKVRYSTVFGDIPAYEIGSRLPELEFVRCFPSSNWKRVASWFDYHVAVSGSIHAALPLSLQDKRCLAWVATPYLPDKVDRARNYPWYRRAVDSVLDTPICVALEKTGLRTCHVLALSHYTAKALERIYPQSAAIAHMPMPVSLDLFSPRPEQMIKGRIGFSGRLGDPRKNIGLLLEALAICRSRGVDVTADLVGGDLDESLTAHIDRLGLRDFLRVSPTKRRNLLPDFYRKLDVFVIPSYQEGLGIVGLEAMACGCPVVSTRCGGVEDYVREGVNGFLVGFSAEQMADAICTIVGNRVLRKTMSDAAIATIRREYTDDAMKGVFWSAFEQTFGSAAQAI